MAKKLIKIIGGTAVFFSFVQFIIFMFCKSWGENLFEIDFLEFLYLLILMDYFVREIAIMAIRQWGRITIINLSIIHFVLYSWVVIHEFILNYNGSPGFWPETIGFMGPGLFLPLFFIFSLRDRRVKQAFIV